jgi:hypothetical protein
MHRPACCVARPPIVSGQDNTCLRACRRRTPPVAAGHGRSPNRRLFARAAMRVLRGCPRLALLVRARQQRRVRAAGQQTVFSPTGTALTPDADPQHVQYP